MRSMVTAHGFVRALRASLCVSLILAASVVGCKDKALEGKGPTPKAEDRPYHKAYRSRRPDEPATSADRPRGRRTPAGTPRAT